MKARVVQRPWPVVAVGSLVLGLCLLLAFTARGESDDFGNGFADAHPISLDSTGSGSQAGSIDPSGDVDFFRFDAPVSGRLTIRQSADASSLDSFLSVYDASRRRIGRNDNGGDGRDAQLQIDVSAGQTYYVRAAGIAGSSGGYRLSFRPDDFGNGFADAHPLSLDSDGAGSQTGTIDPSGDVDFFRFDAPISGPMMVRQAADASALDSFLSVYDASQRRIARNDNGGGGSDAQLKVAVSAGQTYYVRAAGAAGSSGDYRLSFRKQIAQPNFVLILTDDQSFESVAKMPYLSRRTGWYRFDNAFINNATCCPSRATILSGQWSHHTGVEATGQAPTFDDSSTLATWLDEAGYRTGMFGKYHLGDAVAGQPQAATYIPPGWDEWVEHKIGGDSGEYFNYTLNDNGTLVTRGASPGDYATDVLAAKSVDFIHRNADEPFFLMYTPRAPHNPWTPAPRHEGAYADEPVPHAPNFNEPDMSDKPAWWAALEPRKPAEVDKARRRQYEALLAVDDAVEAIVDALEDEQLRGDTVVVFMTDNGFAFAAHRRLGKKCAYEECSRTPLLVKYLGRNDGFRFPELVGNEDIAPTFADLAGISPATPTDGRSFAPMLRTGQAPADWPDEVLLRGYSGGKPGDPPAYWGIRTSEYKYIETVVTGEVELYDLSADPFELESVAEQPEYAAVRAQLAQRLAELNGS